MFKDKVNIKLKCKKFYTEEVFHDEDFSQLVVDLLNSFKYSRDTEYLKELIKILQNVIAKQQRNDIVWVSNINKIDKPKFVEVSGLKFDPYMGYSKINGISDKIVSDNNGYYISNFEIEHVNPNCEDGEDYFRVMFQTKENGADLYKEEIYPCSSVLIKKLFPENYNKVSEIVKYCNENITEEIHCSSIITTVNCITDDIEDKSCTKKDNPIVKDLKLYNSIKFNHEFQVISPMFCSATDANDPKNPILLDNKLHVISYFRIEDKYNKLYLRYADYPNEFVYPTNCDIIKSIYGEYAQAIIKMEYYINALTRANKYLYIDSNSGDVEYEGPIVRGLSKEGYPFDKPGKGNRKCTGELECIEGAHIQDFQFADKEHNRIKITYDKKDGIYNLTNYYPTDPNVIMDTFSSDSMCSVLAAVKYCKEIMSC